MPETKIRQKYKLHNHDNNIPNLRQYKCTTLYRELLKPLSIFYQQSFCMFLFCKEETLETIHRAFFYIGIISVYNFGK